MVLRPIVRGMGVPGRSKDLSSSIHVVVHGKDFVERVFVGIDMHHPAEDGGAEAAAGGLASILRSE